MTRFEELCCFKVSRTIVAVILIIMKTLHIVVERFNNGKYRILLTYLFSFLIIILDMSPDLFLVLMASEVKKRSIKVFFLKVFLNITVLFNTLFCNIQLYFERLGLGNSDLRLAR